MTDDARAPLGPTPGTGDFTQAVRSLSDRFAAEAAELDPDAPIASDAWPTVGGMVDHLGQIQRWCTEVLRTGAAVDRAEHVRPAERDRFAWFVEGSAALATELGTRDPAAGCWAFVPGGTNGFWARRQAHEARKHLWDIRTATTPVPELPEAGGPEMAADIVDELYAVFLARAVRGGLAPLPSPLALVATDAAVTWHLATDWSVVRSVEAPADPAATVLQGRLGDIALFAWDRAAPEDLPDRFAITGSSATVAAYRDAPVHP
ncbi:maleylpyruvate isomerase N-terminal domain-containing protein [Microbacterium aquimaris]|uniref:maleylpyruvate isomerase N-terminal domain-containing protein n=1 Tax=Microbacterium aquimaris TaxID=459816 RepID=UPI002AD2F554|nr:maleylpyruvate isomerase N-terminal domain-containing protein [Microbacterium aquimaris]MDZ8276393.1 maleylpyruvate isomerase N-terminal domain-containing protein [Microbacterium aquimaris]